MARDRCNGKTYSAFSKKDGKKVVKIFPIPRKIYNNTYRLKLKGVRVDAHKKTIYTEPHNEKKILLVRQVKNLLELGFIIQFEIQSLDSQIVKNQIGKFKNS